MPESLYIVVPPPSFRKHLLAHAYDAWIGLGSCIIGLFVIVAELRGTTWSLTVSSLPAWQSVTIGVLHLTSSVLILAAIFDRDTTPWRQWGLERTGLTLSAGAWGSWWLASLTVSGSGVLRILSIVLVGAVVTRAVAITSMKRRAETRASVR